MEIDRCVHWDKVYPLPRDSGVISELIFWKNDLIKLNNRLLFNYSSPQVLAFSDASELGCGAWAVYCGSMKFHQDWESDEMSKSSTWRELKGVALAIQAFAPKLISKQLKMFTDNMGVVSVVRKGSMVPELQELSFGILDFCKSHDIVLDI